MNAERPVLTLVATSLLLVGCAPPEPGDADANTAGFKAPRTPWGDPDLRGTWPLDYINGTPLQRPEAFGERRLLTDEEFAERQERLAALNARYETEIKNNQMGVGHWSEMGQPNRLTSLVVEPANGRLPPLTEEGERISATMKSSWSDIPFDSVADFNALDRCITRGMPASMFPFMYNSGIEIVQAPGVVVIRLEIVHESRVIPVDGRPALSAAIKQWMGESRGHWDGDTLVIETANFNGLTPMIIVGPGSKPVPTSPSMRIIERLTPVDANTIDYEVSVEDPVVLTAPWKAAFPWKRDSSYELFEYGCHEDNHTIRDFITTSRYERAHR